MDATNRLALVTSAWIFVVPLCFGTVAGAGRHGADSQAGFQQYLSGQVQYRSRLKSTAALPGRALYTPFFATIFVGRQAANDVWEKRLFDRAEALLTTADGRIGIRPLSATSIGTGARLFFKDIWHDTDASLTSTLGVSGRKRQQHLLSLALPNSVRLVGGFIREPSESFYGIGSDGNGSKTSFRQEDIYGDWPIYGE